MPLVTAVLAQSLQNSWLVPDGQEFPSSVGTSGQKFADAVAGWFAGATAAGFPCATAAARKAQLAAAATGAFSAQSASAAGAQLALGIAGYIAGQVFGAGVAAAPVATAAGQSAFVAAFSDLDAAHAARAQRIAAGVQVMAVSTLVTFPPVISPPQPIV
jgi:hypothetical protein